MGCDGIDASPSDGATRGVDDPPLERRSAFQHDPQTRFSARLQRHTLAQRLHEVGVTHQHLDTTGRHIIQAIVAVEVTRPGGAWRGPEGGHARQGQWPRHHTELTQGHQRQGRGQGALEKIARDVQGARVPRDGPTMQVVTHHLQTSALDGKARGIDHLTQQASATNQRDVNLIGGIAWHRHAALGHKAIGTHVEGGRPRGQWPEGHASVRSGTPLNWKGTEPVFDQHHVRPQDRARISRRSVTDPNRNEAARLELELGMPTLTGLQRDPDERSGHLRARLGPEIVRALREASQQSHAIGARPRLTGRPKAEPPEQHLRPCHRSARSVEDADGQRRGCVQTNRDLA